MIYKTIIFFIFFLNITIGKGYVFAEEKFEGIIASVDSEIITTYDLSQRIRLALRSLQLEDLIENRDSIRDRVLELLILEKIKKNEAVKNGLEYNQGEIVNFASNLYGFPKEEFAGFKEFLGSEGFDIDVLMEQMTSELLWNKLLQKKLTSNIVISRQEIEKVYNDRMQNLGKFEYDFSEISFENEETNDWQKSKKKMDKFILLLDQGISFKSLYNKLSREVRTKDQGNWVFEENIPLDTFAILKEMKVGEIKKNIKTSNGYKVIKLNKKRLYGNKNFQVSFIKISAFNDDLLSNTVKSNIYCEESNNNKFDEIDILKIDKVSLNDLSSVFKENLENLNEGDFSKLIENNGEFTFLKLCSKEIDESLKLSKGEIEKMIYAKKFNQLANTLLSNLRKNANVKLFNQ